MTRSSHSVVATVLVAAAGLAVLGTSGTLIADSFITERRRPAEQARVDSLLAQVQTEAAFASQVQAGYDRARDASLRREQRNRHLSNGLVAGAAIFLLSAKWLVALRRPRHAAPRHIVQLHAASSAPPGGTAVSSVLGTPGRARRSPVAETPDLSVIDEIVAREGRRPEAAIPVLQAIQQHFRYLPDAALRRVCERTEITPGQLAGVASFYTQFRRTPLGRHVVTVCHGTACHVAGAGRIGDELRRRLGLAPGEDTDEAREFTLKDAPCLGCCTLAPVVQTDGVTHGHVRSDSVAQLLESKEPQASACAAPRGLKPAAFWSVLQPSADRESAGEIRIGLGSCCVANGSGAVYEAVQTALAASGVDAVVKRVGCVGMCHQTPFVEVITGLRATNGDSTRAVLYGRVQPHQARAIVRRHFPAPTLTRRLRDDLTSAIERVRSKPPQRTAPPRAIELRDPPVAAFLGRQKHIATEHCGEIDPLDLDEYLAHGGFLGLQRCAREIGDPDQVIMMIQRSGVRGRGGAGYPTWQKWSKVRQAAGEPKYIICNGDEGDPGAFMDRMLMESYPYRIIEGLAIAAYATGASQGVFYIRAEYPLAVERMRAALQRCEERGLFSSHADKEPRASARAEPIAVSGPLHLRVVQGAGAFVCGEETALIASLEGQRGIPTLRPPYPTEEGLWGKPTLVNNVETFAVVPWILRNGPEAFAALGTPTSKGTKVFALAGKIERGGLIEVPMGITIRGIVEEIGGGVRDEHLPWGVKRHRFKAVQIGGPSGGCIPAELADTPVDYEALAAVGAMMGSGGLVVLDDTDCMVDIARYFLSFTQNQSCGKCTPCRIGTRRMLEILDRLCTGEGRAGDLETLEQLARMVGGTSLCGLGKTAPNPVLTTLRYFRAEYEAHLAGHCPAGRCKQLITYRVTDACTGCTLCAQHCPAGAIALRPYERHEIDATTCTRCDGCRIRCPEDAIRIE